MPIADLEKVRVTANFTLGDGTMYQNVYYYIKDGPDTLSDAGAVTIIAARVEDMYDELAAFVTTDVTEQLCYIDKIAWDTDMWKVTANIGTFTITFTPTQTGDALPYTVAPFVIFKTTRPKTVGKKFLFPFDEAWQADSIVVAGALAGMVAYGAEVIDDITIDGSNWLRPGVPRTGVEAWYTFQTAVANDILGSQKRRRPGVGA